MRISVVTDDVTGVVPLAEQFFSARYRRPADYKQRRFRELALQRSENGAVSFRSGSPHSIIAPVKIIHRDC